MQVDTQVDRQVGTQNKKISSYVKNVHIPYPHLSLMVRRQQHEVSSCKRYMSAVAAVIFLRSLRMWLDMLSIDVKAVGLDG